MEAPVWLKRLFGVIALIATLVSIFWLAGNLFFIFSKSNPLGKTNLFTWWHYWQAYQDNPEVAKRLIISLCSAFALILGALAIAYIAAKKEIKLLHGNARFARLSEIIKSGLFSKTGIIVGKYGKKFLIFSGLQFVLLAAPTRSGKGVGIVIPNLLNWRDSVVCSDIKLENFLITSKFRAKWGQEVYLFNPFSITEEGSDNPLNGKTHRYNPLGYISDDLRIRITDIMAIAHSIYPEGGDDFFNPAARNLFLGLTLYLCETPTLPRTIGELLRQSSGKGQPVKEFLQGLINQRNYTETEIIDEKTGETKIELEPINWDGQGLPPLSNECIDALNRFLSTSDNTLTSILATFNVPLTLWASPVIDAATSANDFDLRDIRKKRMSIYLGIPPNKLEDAKLLMNLFYTQLINLNTSQQLNSTPDIKYQCLLLNDEFSAPGRIGIIDKANSFMASYGLRLLTIIHSPSQIEANPPKGYGKEGAQTLLTNHALQILFTPRKNSDAKEYSEMLGTYTFKAKGKSRQVGMKYSQTESESDQKRSLMLPQELKEMSQKKQIISLENTKPILCDKIVYYADPAFMDRLKSVSPTLSTLSKKLPSKPTIRQKYNLFK